MSPIWNDDHMPTFEDEIDDTPENDHVLYVDREYEEGTTICSNMHCYNRAKITGDPAHPPFCEPCKAKTAANQGKK